MLQSSYKYFPHGSIGYIYLAEVVDMVGIRLENYIYIYIYILSTLEYYSYLKFYGVIVKLHYVVVTIVNLTTAAVIFDASLNLSSRENELHVAPTTDNF